MPTPSGAWRRLLFAALLAAAAVVLLASPALAIGGTGLSPFPPDAKSPNGKNIYNLYLGISIPALVVFFLVEALLLTIILRFRRSRQPAGYRPPQWHGNTRLEMVWTVLPFLILVGIGYASFRELQQDFVRPADSVTDMEITVIGRQFGWTYKYPEGFDVKSDGLQATPMVVPTGKLTRLKLQGQDVIHSFWVPDLTGKTDTVPGYDNYTWIKVSEPGQWRGECAELCGSGHYAMQILVKAVSPEEYDAWAADQAQKARATPTPSASASPSAAASPSASPSGSPSPSPSGSAQPSPSGSPGASPSPSGSPRPSP